MDKVDATVNLNHNAAECIKSASHFGYTTYANICNQTTYDLAWGGVDWLACILLFILGLGVCLLMLGFAAFLIHEIIYG